MSGKKFVDSVKSFDRDQLFTPTEALELAAKVPGARYGTIEVRPVLELT